MSLNYCITTKRQSAPILGFSRRDFYSRTASCKLAPREMGPAPQPSPHWTAFLILFVLLATMC